jgi:hypothetical protein
VSIIIRDDGDHDEIDDDDYKYANHDDDIFEG